MDFTLNKYCEMLESLINQQYRFQTMQQFIESPLKNCIILRHDVDKKPSHSLKFAHIQQKYSIRGTYYFRSLPISFDPLIIQEISSLGHEIGYHYENISYIAHSKKVKDREQLYDLAWDDFRTQLDRFRQFYPVKTICMHGAPLSKYDNKNLWDKYDYKTEGIIAEPYLDIDFLQVSYYTDTGRRWDGDRFSVRDLVDGIKSKAKSTDDLIRLFQSHLLKDQVMLTFHPQRWINQPLEWFQEYLLQSIKNEIKKMIKTLRKNDV